VSEARAFQCLDVDPAQITLAVESSRTIVIATVREENGGALVRLEPSAFLLGAASNEPIRPQYPQPLPECALARLTEGQRILVFLGATDGVLDWPSAGQVFWLEDGKAIGGGSTGDSLAEIDLVQRIRQVTGQYAVPAATENESAGIDWSHTVIPLGVVLLIIFGIGLVLMRVWHRIDPS